MISDNLFRSERVSGRRAFLPLYPRVSAQFLLLLVLTAAAIPLHGRDKNVLQYGEGLVVNVPLPEPEVVQIVEEVTQNTIIRGTKEYNKDEYVAGAVAATSTPAFPKWTEGGKVFYKVRKQALDPRNFKGSNDVGTLAVRYVVKPQGDKNTILRIDAVFVEDFRRTVHQSDGSVETSEYKDIQDRLASIELVKKETAEALRAKQEHLARQNFGLGSDSDSSSSGTSSSRGEDISNSEQVVLSTPPPIGVSPEDNSGDGAAHNNADTLTLPAQQSLVSDQFPEGLAQHLAELRRQVERLVMKPGAPLKSAPFHTASTLKSLEPGVEVLILISTPYWYGVETHDGQHGWIRRDELEQVP